MRISQPIPNSREPAAATQQTVLRHGGQAVFSAVQSLADTQPFPASAVFISRSSLAKPSFFAGVGLFFFIF